MRLLSSVQVQYPKKLTKCDLRLKCKGEKLSPRVQAIQIVCQNGAGPVVEYACIPCGRQVLLTHIARLARMQGYIVDALNQANAVHYLRDGITTSTLGHVPETVHIAHPTADEFKGTAEIEKRATEAEAKILKYTKASTRDESE